MPLPKGIYHDPEVRRAWVGERQTVLNEFDRLVGIGQSTRAAAKAVGHHHTSLRRIRDSLDTMEGRATGRAKGERIDLGLALLSVANPPGPERVAMTAADIAAWCDCSHAAIQSIERRAMRKVRQKLEKLLSEEHAPAEVAVLFDLAA